MSDRPPLPELDIDLDREAFIGEEAVRLLRSLNPARKPEWGLMTAQHMVEHLTFITENSLGRRPVDLLIPEEKLPKYKAFLMGPLGFARNFKFPMLPEHTLPDLRHEDLPSALSEFEAVNREYLGMIRSPDFESAPHPFYGPMNREEATMFQFKHLMHHLTQFGLIPE